MDIAPRDLSQIHDLYSRGLCLQAYQRAVALAPLREEGVLVFGSGFLTHNMRYAFRPGIPAWAREFDEWAADALSRFDVDALQDFRARAPAAQQAFRFLRPQLAAAVGHGLQRLAQS